MSSPTDISPIPGVSLAQFTRKDIMGAAFETTERYTQLELVGMGISGLVCSARDRLANQAVAIKKLCNPFKTENIAKHIFREVRLLKQLRHGNIIHLNDIFISPSENMYRFSPPSLTPGIIN
jgi:p38 MAP kinase